MQSTSSIITILGSDYVGYLSFDQTIYRCFFSSLIFFLFFSIYLWRTDKKAAAKIGTFLQSFDQEPEFKDSNPIYRIMLKDHFVKKCLSRKIKIETRIKAVSKLHYLDDVNIPSQILNDQDEDPRIRIAAAFALHELGSTEALQSLCYGLNNDNPDIVPKISELLHDHQTSIVVDHLIEAFSKHRKEHKLTEIILDSLEKIFEETNYYDDILNILRDYLITNKCPKNIQKAVNLIVAINSPDGLEIQKRALSSLPKIEDQLDENLNDDGPEAQILKIISAGLSLNNNNLLVEGVFDAENTV